MRMHPFKRPYLKFLSSAPVVEPSDHGLLGIEEAGG